MSRQGQLTSVSSTITVPLNLGTFLTDQIDILNFNNISVLGFWGTVTSPTGNITDEYSNDGENWIPGYTNADLAVDAVYNFDYSNFTYRYVRLVVTVLTGGGSPDEFTYTVIKK